MKHVVPRRARADLGAVVARACLLAALVALAACVTPATVVVVSIDTDVPPDVPLAVRVFVQLGSGPLRDASPGYAAMRTDAGTFTLPASFGIVPAPGQRHDAPFTLLLEALSPTAVIRRTARTAFIPDATVRLRLFLTLRCADTALDADCTAAGLGPRCTAQDVCEARGDTCGDDGRCVAVTMPVTLLDAGIDATVREAAVHCGALGEPCCDSGACGASLVCAGGLCACGGRDQPCCGGTDCNPGIRCAATGFGPICQCGARNEVCCSGTACDASLTCNATGLGPICQCGARNQVCCAGTMCDASLLCNATGFGPICQCGAHGQVCCAGGVCDAGQSCVGSGFGPICE